MIDNMQVEFNKLGLDDTWTDFRRKLSRFGVVDIGKIKSIDGNRARVTTFSLRGVSWIEVYCEILMIGDLNGFLGNATPGQLCLVIYPRSPLAEAASQTLANTQELYSDECAKCIPLTPFIDQKVNISYAEDSLLIGAENYSVAFSVDAIRAACAKFSREINFEEGSIQEDWANGAGNEEHKSTGDFERGCGYTFDLANEAFNWQSHIAQNADGSVKIQTAGLVNSSTHESFGSTQCSLNADGSVELKTGVAEDDKFKSLISIDTSGNITIASYADGSVKSQLQVKSDGSISINNEGQYKIEGKNGVVIDGKSGKVSIKNSTYSLADAFNDLITVLDTFKTQGSPAAHTAVPAQFTTLQQKLAQFLE